MINGGKKRKRNLRWFSDFPPASLLERPQTARVFKCLRCLTCQEGSQEPRGGAMRAERTNQVRLRWPRPPTHPRRGAPGQETGVATSGMRACVRESPDARQDGRTEDVGPGRTGAWPSPGSKTTLHPVSPPAGGRHWPSKDNDMAERQAACPAGPLLRPRLPAAGPLTLAVPLAFSFTCTEPLIDEVWL